MQSTLEHTHESFLIARCLTNTLYIKTYRLGGHCCWIDQENTVVACQRLLSSQFDLLSGIAIANFDFITKISHNLFDNQNRKKSLRRSTRIVMKFKIIYWTITLHNDEPCMLEHKPFIGVKKQQLLGSNSVILPNELDLLNRHTIK